MDNRTVVIDNYDSFTYNLVHYIEEIVGERPAVFRNDQVELSELVEFDIIVLSPGPGLPEEANLLMSIIETYASSKVILGVCLGHQAIALHFGGKLANLEKVYHGVASEINVINEDIIHQGFKSLAVGRYHSWIVTNENFPSELQVTTRDKEGSVMSFKHQTLPIFGIQYHPESVLTPKGKVLLNNFFMNFRK